MSKKTNKEDSLDSWSRGYEAGVRAGKEEIKQQLLDLLDIRKLIYDAVAAHEDDAHA